MTGVKQRQFLDNRYLVVVVGCIIISAIIGSYFLFIRNTAPVSQAAIQVLDWILRPIVSGTLPSATSYALSAGLLAFDFLLGLSVILAILPKELQKNSRQLVLSSSMLVGLGLVGILAIISVEFNNLTRESILSIAIGIIGITNYLNYRQYKQTVLSFFQEAIKSCNFKLIMPTRYSIKPAIISVVIVIYVLLFFHATAFPVTEWDALIYHANVAKIWYENAPNYQVIAGPSVGIELSYPYPPLFPAIGAAHYILAGEFNDLYLKIVPPLLSLLTLSLTSLISKMYLKSVPRTSVLFLLSMPFFIMYSIWPTNYSTLMAFTIAAILFLLLTLEKRKWQYSVLTGSFVGFAMLSTYLGIILAVFAAVVIGYHIIRKMISSRQTESCSRVSISFVILSELRTVVLPIFISLVSISCLWYVFNWITVGDPVFPFGSRFFQSEYLDQVVLTKSLEQIKQNALGYWGQSTGTELFKKQIYSIIFDPHLYSLGLLPAIIGFVLAILRRNVAMVILGIWISIVIMSQLIQGWFWLRTFTMILPPAAILSAYSVDTVITTLRQKNAKITAAALKYAIYALLFAAIIFPSFIIAMVGINHPTIIYGIPKELPYDFMYSWKNVGNDNSILAGTFLGEADAWQWMNITIPSNSKVATLDAREYHVRSNMFFYLDGKEAVPLLDMDDPFEIRKFLIENGVRYIWAPGSTFRTSAAYPIVNEMPLFKYLGTRDFPIVRIYDAWVPPSIMYDVYPSTDTVQSLTTFLTGTTKQNGYEIVEAGNVRGGLLFAHTPQAGIYKISILYKDSGAGNVDFNLEENNSWQIGYSVLTRTDSNDIKIHTFHINGKANNFSVIGIYSHHEDFEIQQVIVSKVDQFGPSADFSGVVIGKTDGSVSSTIASANQEQIRLFINTPDSKSYKVTVIYQDIGIGNIDFNLQQKDGSWQIGYSTLKRYNSWDTKVHTFYIDGRPNSVIPIGIFAYNEDLVIKKVDIKPAMEPEPSIQLSGIVIQDDFNIVRSGDTDARLLINAPLDEIYKVTITYADIGSSPIDFNFQNSNDTWSTISSITRENSGETKVHTFYINGSTSSIVTLGIYSYDNDFYFKNTDIEVNENIEPQVEAPLTNVPEPLADGNNNTKTEEPSVIDVMDKVTKDGHYLVKAGDVNNRLFLATLEDGIYRVIIEYNDTDGTGPIDFNLQNEDGTWQGSYSTIVKSNSNITKIHSFYIDGRANSVITLGIYAYESDLAISSIEFDKIKEFPLTISDEGLHKVTISYNDTNTSTLDFVTTEGNELQVHSVSKTNSNATKLYTLYVQGGANAAAIGSYPYDNSITITDTSKLSLSEPSVAFSNVIVQNKTTIVTAGDTSPRLYVNTPDNGLYRLTLVYADTASTPVDINLQNEDGTWQGGYSTIFRTNSNETKVHTFELLGKNSTINLGIAAYGQDLVIHNVTIASISATDYTIINSPMEGLYRIDAIYNDTLNDIVRLSVISSDGTKTTHDLPVGSSFSERLYSFFVKGSSNSSFYIIKEPSDFDVTITSTYAGGSKPIVGLSGFDVGEGYYLAKKGDPNIKILANANDDRFHYIHLTYDTTFKEWQRIDFNLLNEDGTWSTLKKRFDDSPVNRQAWITLAPFEGRNGSPIIIGIFLPEADFKIYDITIS